MQINLGKHVDNRAFRVHLRHSGEERMKIEKHDDNQKATYNNNR